MYAPRETHQPYNYAVDHWNKKVIAYSYKVAHTSLLRAVGKFYWAYNREALPPECIDYEWTQITRHWLDRVGSLFQSPYPRARRRGQLEIPKDDWHKFVKWVLDHPRNPHVVPQSDIIEGFSRVLPDHILDISDLKNWPPEGIKSFPIPHHNKSVQRASIEELQSWCTPDEYEALKTTYWKDIVRYGFSY